MKKVICITITLLFILLCLPKTQAFDTYVAHPLLARAAAERYNQSASVLLTEDEIEWLTQGSLEEDQPIIRAFNHFYNPLTGDGLRIAGVLLGLASPVWAHASLEQRWQLGGDCSWPTAVEAYKNNDKAKGIRCLGHVLHLLQDAGVPAHTRNDQHMTGDRLEEWTKFYNPGVSSLAPSILPQCRTDQDCIKEVATWINKHFLSEDTIRDSNFPLPYSEATVEEGYLMYKGRKIAIYHPGRRMFVLNQEIMAEYWQAISPVVAEYGKRLIEIFFDEVGGREEIIFKEPSDSPISSPNISMPIPTPTQNSERTTLSPPLPPRHSSFVISPSVSSLSLLPAKSPSSDVSTSVTQPVPQKDLILSPLSSLLNLILPPFFQSDRRLPDTYYTTRPALRTKSQSAEFIIASDRDGVSFECRFNNEEWLPCLSSYSRNSLGEGTYTLEARAVSHEGKDPSPVHYSWTIDLTPPLSYLIPIIQNNNREARFTFGSEVGAHFECRLDNQLWQDCSSPQVYHNLGSGSHSFFVRAIDQVGNRETTPLTHTWLTEIGSISQPTIEFPPHTPFYTPDLTITLRGQRELGTSVSLNGSSEGVTYTEEVWESTQGLTPGENTFTILAHTEEDETSEALEIKVIQDSIFPTAQIESLPEVILTPEFIVSWHGTDNQGNESLRYDVRYKVDNEDWQVWQTDVSVTAAQFTNAPLHQLLSFEVRAIDQAGNRGDWSPTASTRYIVGTSDHLVISQLSAEGMAGDKTEFIELYNPTEEALVLEGLRLEKKAATGFFWDTIVPTTQFGTMIIQPKGYFLIAGKDYNYTTIPDITIEEELLYNQSGHVRLVGLLGEEIDKVGYGSASQPEGLPAPSLSPNISLERKAQYTSTAESLRAHPEEGNGYDSNFNYFDFVLQSVIFPRASDYQAGTINLNSNLTHLWHLDECNGQTSDSITNRSHPQPTTWIVGKYGCALSQYWPAYEDIFWSLPEQISEGEVTISFYAREPVYAAHTYMWFIDSLGEIVAGIRSNIAGDAIWYQGQEILMPSSLPSDGNWHQISVVFSNNYLAWYRDGVMLTKKIGNYTWDRPITNLNIGEDNQWWQMDELAIWEEALSSPEVKALTQEQLSPRLIRPTQTSAQLLHFWNFDEGVSPAVDAINGSALTYTSSIPGRSGQGVGVYWQQHTQPSADIPTFNSTDISLSYWWQRGAQGAGGGYVGLYNPNTMIIFGSGGGYLESYYLFNGSSDFLGAHIPNDELWHHIAIVYDSYQYQIRYYIDGIEKARKEMIWPLLPYNKLIIRESQHGFHVDDLKVWQGALTAEEVAAEANLP